MNDKLDNSRDAYILKFLPFVEKIADKIFKTHNGIFEKEDFVNIGVIGLMDAIEKYDSNKNVMFETYAKWRIKGAIYDELRSSGKLSRSQMDRVNRLYRADEKLQQKLSRAPSDNELMDYMGIKSVQLNEIYNAVHFLSNLSLESTIFCSPGQEIELKDVIEDFGAENPQQVLELNERRELLKYAIDQLKDREQIILNLIYFEELPIKDIAEILGISSSRVSQLHGKILLKVRNYISNALEMV